MTIYGTAKVGLEGFESPLLGRWIEQTDVFREVGMVKALDVFKSAIPTVDLGFVDSFKLLDAAMPKIDFEGGTMAAAMAELIPSLGKLEFDFAKVGHIFDETLLQQALGVPDLTRLLGMFADEPFWQHVTDSVANDEIDDLVNGDPVLAGDLQTSPVALQQFLQLRLLMALALILTAALIGGGAGLVAQEAADGEWATAPRDAIGVAALLFGAGVLYDRL